MTQELQIAETAAKNAERIQYVSSGATVIFGLTLNEWGVLIGMIVALGGFVLTWYYKHKSFLLREQEHHARMSSRNRRSTDPKYFTSHDDDDE